MKKQPIPRPDALITLPRKTIGRPTRLTDEIASKILMAIKGGSYRTVAAQWAGVEVDVFCRWMGMKGEPYETFRRHVEEAEAHSELKAVTNVVKASDQDAKYAVAFLERRFPVRWSRAVPSANLTLDLGSMLKKAIRESRRTKTRAKRGERSPQATSKCSTPRGAPCRMTRDHPVQRASR